MITINYITILGVLVIIGGILCRAKSFRQAMGEMLILIGIIIFWLGYQHRGWLPHQQQTAEWTLYR